MFLRGARTRAGGFAFVSATVKDADGAWAAETHVVAADGRAAKLPAPGVADYEAMAGPQAIFRLRGAWAPQGGPRFEDGDLIALDVARFLATGEARFGLVFAPGERRSVDGVVGGDGVAYLAVLDDVRGRVLALAPGPDRWRGRELELPKDGAVAIVAADAFSGRAAFAYEDALTPPRLYWSDDAGATLRLHSAQPPRFDAGPLEATRAEARSKDGTRVPYTLIRRRDADGPVPTVLTGYGGFGVSIAPEYDSIAGRLWLARGGAYAVANVRGGGEFGPRWYADALGPLRANAFDDLAAVATDLIDQGVTTPARLGFAARRTGGCSCSPR